MKKTSFTENMTRLETIVNELEAGPVELDRALQLYEEGVLLASACQKELEKAGSKILKLSQKIGGEYDLEEV